MPNDNNDITVKDVSSNQENGLNNSTLHPRAQYTKCNKDQEKLIAATRYTFSEMYKFIDHILTDCREKSLVCTKLEEAQMWTIKGITRNNYIN